MNDERLNLNSNYKSNLIEMLKTQGLSDADIDVIVNGTYKQYTSSEQIASSSIFQNDEFSSIIQALSEDYTLEEMPNTLGISQEKIEAFKNDLQTNNLTIDSVKAFNRYSSGSNMILSAKRGVPRETISQGIDAELESRLTEYGFPQEHISKIHDYVNGLDYSKPLHENWSKTTSYLEQYGISRKYTAAINSTVMHKNSLAHLDETLSSLDQGLTTRLSESMKLTRAVKSDFITKQLAPGEDIRSLVGRKIEENGYSSTSPIYDTSFAKYDDYDVVYDIYAPKGTQGTSITPFSSYGTAEEEVLLNSNDLYITDVIPGFVDKNGKTKTVLKSLMLSKDKSCYKGIGGKEQSFSDIKYASKEELMTMKEQLRQQQINTPLSTMNDSEYVEYRQKVNALMERTPEDEYLRSQFTVYKNQEQQDRCYHTVQTAKEGQEPQTLLAQDFEYSEKFRKGMIEPSVVDFSRRSPISSTNVVPTEQPTQQIQQPVQHSTAQPTPIQQTQPTQNCNVNLMSENNNMMSVNNIGQTFAQQIQQQASQISPDIFMQQQSQIAQMQMAQAGPVLSLTMNGMGGFVNILVLTGISILVGAITLFVIIGLLK